MKIIELNDSNSPKNQNQTIRKLLENNLCLVGVFSKLCIHCQNMKSQWSFLKKKLKKTKCNGILFEIDSEQLKYIDSSSLTNSVKGFPSIMVFKNGKKVGEYAGNRTSEDMFKFFKPYLIVADNKTLKNKKKRSKKSHKRRNIRDSR